MAKKEYLFEIEVSRGWGGVEQIRIATGTDNPDDLKNLVNQMAESMQDRADNHQQQLQKIEDAVRQAQDEQAKLIEAEAAAETDNVKE